MPTGIPRPRLGRRPRPRLLVVEGHADIADLLRVVFEPTWEVHGAATLREARGRLVAGPRFDVVLADGHLADGDGADLCREAKRAFPALRVAILTAHVHARTEALAAGADLLVPKPFDPEALLAAVSELLRLEAAG